MERFELSTSSLPRKRSTPELHWRSLSGRRGSNSRPLAWKANALPTELLPQIIFLWAKMDSNHRRYKPADLQSAPFGHSGILPIPKRTFEPMEGVEPTTPRLQITCSSQLSYIGISRLNVSSETFFKGIAKIGIYSYSPKLFNLFCHFFALFLISHQIYLLHQGRTRPSVPSANPG